MAKLPSQRRISREDLTDAPSWIVRLLNPLNSFMEAVYSALNGRITFVENVRSQFYQTDFTTASDYELNGTFEAIQFAKSFSAQASGVLIAHIYKKGALSEPLIGSFSLNWFEDSGNIKIKYISGLSDSTSYVVRFLVI